MKKKLVSLFLSLAMIFSLLPMSAFAAEGDNAGSGKTFPDIASHWGKSSVERWAGYGVLNGDNTGKFNPDASMTRAEFATMLVNLMGYTVKGANNFGDVKAGDWFADAILKLAAAGIMKGDGQNANPNAPISRQEAAVLLCRVFGISGGSSTSFADNGSIASWAMDSVAALYSRGMIAGVGNNMFAPLDNITRASVAKMIDNMISTYVASGSATVDKSTDGIVLVVGGTLTVKENATVARMVVAPKASGATVTVEKGATVTSMELAGSNATVNGAGTIKDLVVTGNGATIDKAVTVSKIANNGTGDVKYGDKTIKPGDTSDTKTEEPTKPSGGSGGNGGGTKPTPPTDLGTADTVDAFIDAINSATGNVKMAVADGVTNLGTVAITNNNVTGLSLNLNKVTQGTLVINSTSVTSIDLDNVKLDDLTINSESATSITLDGTSITNLTINTPKADVTNNVPTTNVTIQAVKGDSYVAKAATGTITLAGPGHVNVPAGTTLTNPIVVNTAEPVKLSGEITEVESGNDASQITLGDIGTTPVTVSGKAGSVSTTVTNTEISIAKDAEIGALQTATDVKVSGEGTVGSVNVTGNTAVEIKVSDGTTIQEITATSPAALENVSIKDSAGNDIPETTIPRALKSLAPTGTFTGVMPNAPGAATGSITGLTAGLEYKAEADTSWTAFDTANENANSTKLAAGTYLIRVAEKTVDGNIYKPSESVRVTVPAAVAVTSATITGNAVVGQTLTAVANSNATGTLAYTWTIPGDTSSSAAEPTSIGTGRTLNVPASAAGKTITLTITNYTNNSATATVVATADKTDLTKLIADAETKMVGVVVKDDGTAATTVPNGIFFVGETVSKALEDAIKAATAVINAPMTTEKVTELTTALNTAMAAYAPVEGSKTATDAELKAELTAQITVAEALKATATETDSAIKVAPTAKWVTATEMKALTDAIAAAKAVTTPTVTDFNTLTTAMETFRAAMKPGATINTTALLAAIDAANLNAASVVVDTAAENVVPSAKWVTAEDKKAYTDAIPAANATYDTQAKVNEALSELAEATKTFDAAKQAGKKDIVAPNVTGLVANRTSSTEAVISFNTNETGSYQWSKDGGKTWSTTETIAAVGKVTFTVNGLEEGKTYTITVKVSDGTTATTGNVTVQSVNAPDYTFDSAKVEKATIRDVSSAIKDENLSKNYYVSGKAAAEGADHNVLVTITGVVREHLNANGADSVKGSWVGFVAPKPEGATSFKYAFDTTLTAVNDAANLKDGNMNDLAFYANASAATPKTWVKIVWTVGTEMPTTQTVIYKMDLTGVKTGFGVTFTSDGAAVATQIVAKDDKATAPTEPTKDGYTFGGWFNGNAEASYDFNAPVTADLTLTAKWTAVAPDPATPVITIGTQPQATTSVTEGSISGMLSVVATVNPTATLSYQWYQKDAEGGADQAVNGATAATFTIPTTLIEGTYTYYCVVSAPGATPATSASAQVIVQKATSITVTTAQALTDALANSQYDTVLLGENLSVNARDLSNAWKERTVTLNLNEKTLTITKDISSGKNDKTTDETVFVGPVPDTKGTTETAPTAAPGTEGNCKLTDITICNGNVNAENVVSDVTANFCVETGHKLTFGNVGVNLSASGTAILVRGNDATLDINDSEITSKGVYAVTTNAKGTVNDNVVININNSTLKTTPTNGDDCPVMINVPSKVNISGSTITGQRMGLLVRSGDVTVTNTKISATAIGKYYDAGILDYYGSPSKSQNGNEAPWGAVVVTKSGNSGYKGDVNLTLEQCTLSCALDETNSNQVAEKYLSALYAEKRTTVVNDKFAVTMTDCTVETGNVVDRERKADGKDGIVTGYTGTILTSIPDDSQSKDENSTEETPAA